MATSKTSMEDFASSMMKFQEKEEEIFLDMGLRPT
jgi:hypothetical protein